MSRYSEQRHVALPVDKATFDGVLRSVVPNRSEALLPSATVQAHAAMLHRLPGGELGLVWFGGTQEGIGDISIWFSRLAEGATGWSDPVRITDDPQRSEQNPVLFTTPNGDLWLLYTSQPGGHQDRAQVHRRVSQDNGLTWTAAEVLFDSTDDGGVFVRQPVVVTHSGRWLLPIFVCARTEGERWVGNHDRSAVMVSDDNGETWQRVEVPDSTGSVHMNIVQLPDGRLHALYRSRWADHIYRSVSDDDGVSWTAPLPLELPNNNSSLQHALLGSGQLALIYNHASRDDADAQRASLYDEIDDDGELDSAAAQDVELVADDGEGTKRAFWGAPRAPLTLAISRDGSEWNVVADVEQGDGFCLTNNSKDHKNREFSYPVLLPHPDGSLDLAYTLFRRTIKHVRLAPGWENTDG